MKPSEIASKIADAAKRLGWTLEVRGGILTIHKYFPAGSDDGLREADMTCYSILELLPRTSPGSDWGTDCGGIGALSALKYGHFKMNRSGGNKMVLKALAKI